ncbi:GNAT family N-acetyltransferase [Paenibacillus sp. GCM10027629]|uniref:GNAT family N-acetyltransferase n=1 Tax=Paenibacillus sp. GCM10027629 TaxID=3273414 RepID=UPI003632D14B
MIEYRSMREQDVPSLMGLCSTVWEFERDCSDDKILQHIEEVFLYLAMASGSFSTVAVRNGEPVGVIIGRHKSKYQLYSNLKYGKMLIPPALKLLLSSEGRAFIRSILAADRLQQRMLKNARSNNYDGELVLLVTHPDVQGRGVGKQLLHSFISYMKKNRASNFYLFTNTKCNYPFYDRQGFHCVEKQHVEIQPGIAQTNFMYELQQLPDDEMWQDA